MGGRTQEAGGRRHEDMVMCVREGGRDGASEKAGVERMRTLDSSRRERPNEP